jgi:acetyl esterase/lipase
MLFEPVPAPATFLRSQRQHALRDVSGLGPGYIEVGELDIFRNEGVAYAQRFMHAGVPVELHVHTGANHGFDGLAPHSELARRAMSDRLRVIETI